MAAERDAEYWQGGTQRTGVNFVVTVRPPPARYDDLALFRSRKLMAITTFSEKCQIS
jgi:hypothetical protein